MKLHLLVGLSTLTCLLTAAAAVDGQLFRRCDYEKSGYFVILDQMTFDEAANACVSLGASLASPVPGVFGLIETCSDWEFDTLEPWVARRLGDIDCPYVSKQYHKKDRIKLQDCQENVKRPALCWQYPFAWITETHKHRLLSTLTDYRPSIVSTETVAPTISAPITSTFTWTTTVTETRTKQTRVPHYLFDYDPLAGNVSLTTTITEFDTLTATIPAIIVEEEALAIAVHYVTSWETSFTSTETVVVSPKC